MKRQELLKLLNLQQMMDEYTRELRPKQKEKTSNRRNVEGNVTTIQNKGKFSNTRTQSLVAFGKKPAVKSKLIQNNDKNVMCKTQSSRMYCVTDKVETERRISENRYKNKYFNPKAFMTGKESTTRTTVQLCRTLQKSKNKCAKLTSETNESFLQENLETTDVNTSQCLKNLISKAQKVKFNTIRSKKTIKINNPKLLLRGRYQIQKLIGRGLSGEVHKARDILSDRYVAIKIIPQDNIEYDFIKQLSHPNLIQYYNSFIQNGNRYIVLQYLPKTLAEVSRKVKLSEIQVKKIFKGIANGLLYLHSLSYAHRDIKLDNIVTNLDYSIVKFIDFGLCVDISQCGKKQAKRVCGTVSYMAPEIISGVCEQPKKADIWSLGVALYHLSVGRNPFTGRQEFQIFRKIQNNKIVFPNQMSKQLKQLLSGMLSKDPSMRPSIFEVVNHQWLCQ